MIWLELRTKNIIYNTGWNFSESVWAPTRKKNGNRWPFWESVNDVVKGDLIFHLRHINGRKQFLGYSIAATDVYITRELPSDIAHDWDFSGTFYKVDLINYTSLDPIIELADFFSVNDRVLRNFYRDPRRNKSFYTIQRNKLQCLFGAYFSRLDETIVELLEADLLLTEKKGRIGTRTETGENLKELRLRIGQQKFSANVKNNFNHKCCFPGCSVEGKHFLVGGHIDRWCDNVDLRGLTSNGICFCLMHDKAFERGYFTLNKNLKVVINPKILKPNWLDSFLQIGENMEIKSGEIAPSLTALKRHWKRIGYESNGEFVSVG